MTLKEQLPLDIFPTDDDEIEVLHLSIPCQHCGEVIPDDLLHGTVEHDTIKELKITVKCVCAYCKADVSGEYKLGAESGQLVLFEKRQTKWHKIQLT